MKKVFITGGSKGIGLALARRFHRENFKVIICARGAENLESVAAALPGISTYQADLADRDQIRNMTARINADFGPLDVLINNAGLYIPGQIHSENEGVLENLIATNLLSAYHITRALIPGMMAQKNGTIVNICSTASITPYINGGSYCITKFGMLGFSKVLREEMKPHNIRVMSILPGATFTDSWEGTELPEDRFMPPDDVAELIWTNYQLSQRTVVEEVILRPMEGDIT